MPDIDLRGCSIHYEIDDFAAPWKPSEVVLIQHGVGRSGRFFHHWVPYLAGDYRVVRRDMRGHGQSSDPGRDYVWNAEDLLLDMLAFLDALKLDRVHYIGESAGGVLGLAFAARFPERLHSLTVCSSPFALPHARLDNLVKATGHKNMGNALDNMPIADWVRANLQTGSLTTLGPDHTRWIIAEWEKNPVHVLKGIIGMLPSVDLSEMLPKIAVPTLLLCPARSMLTTPREQTKMRDMIPLGRMEVIDGSGHEIYVDQAPACIAAIKTMWESIPRMARRASQNG